MSVTLIDAWRRVDPDRAADALKFWTSLGLGPADRQERLSEICALAYVGETFAGVATAYLADAPPLRARMAFYRCAVAPAFRKRDIAYRLTGYTRRVLERWARAHPEEKVMGMAAAIEAAELSGFQLKPTWSEHDLHLNLAFYLEDGKQLRVAWFKHARLEP